MGRSTGARVTPGNEQGRQGQELVGMNGNGGRAGQRVGVKSVHMDQKHDLRDSRGAKPPMVLVNAKAEVGRAA